MKNTAFFRWMLTTCCVFDILLLLWMFNPNPIHGWPEHPGWYQEMADGVSTAEGKPAPLKVAAARALFAGRHDRFEQVPNNDIRSGDQMRSR